MRFTSQIGLGLAFSLGVSLLAPGAPVLARAQTATFTDVSTDYWAHDYIEGLAKLNIISGFPDGTFDPNAVVTRAQFAAVLQQAFLQSPSPSKPPQAASAFVDVPATYWAADSINAARSAGFLAGRSGNQFDPDSEILKGDALLVLANGLKLKGTDLGETTLLTYRDSANVSDYTRSGIIAAIEAGIVVNYPAPDLLKSYYSATRAEIAAFIYQALVNEGRAEPLAAAPEKIWPSAPLVTLPTSAEGVSFDGTNQRLATLTSGGKSFQVWNIQTGALVREIEAEGEPDDSVLFDAIALSKDGTQVATLTQGANKAVELALWSVGTGEQLWQKPIGIANSSFRDQDSLQSSVQVAFSPDNKQIATSVNLGTQNTKLRLQDAATGDLLQALGFEDSRNDSTLEQFTFSPDGKFLVDVRFVPIDPVLEEFSPKTVEVWQRTADNRFNSLWSSPIYPNFHVVDIAISNSNYLSVFTSGEAYESRLEGWNLQPGIPTGQIGTLAWDRTDKTARLSPDGKYYFAQGDVAGSRLGNVQTGTTQAIPGYDVAFNDSGSYLATYKNENAVRVFSKVLPSEP